jgi:CheY-like chemotaxis protein
VVAPPDIPPPSPRPRTSTTTLEALPSAPAPVSAAPSPEPAGESLADAVERALAQLRFERTAPKPPGPAAVAPEPPVDRIAVEAAAAPAREAAPFAAASPAVAEPEPLPAPRASELATRVPARRALVADDSLVARIFLGRLLEKRGWIVESVPDAASLWDELNRGPWALVCADIAMPDAQGAEHVARLVGHLARHSASTTCIVLTRDAADEAVAREAGATLVLRKPFEPERLDPLLPA